LNARLTSVDDVIKVAILKCAPYLSCKFSCDAFAKAPMADDIVEHLAPIDILENHVVMVLMDDHLAHPAYVRVIQKHR